MKYLSFCIVLFFLICIGFSSPEEDFVDSLKTLQTERQLKGMQVQVTKNGQAIFNSNIGQKDEANQLIDNSTMFRVASLSKSFASVAILQLVEQNKLQLNASLSSIFGFTVQNPNFPGAEITLEMILSHQSSLIECDPYYTNFLMDTYNAKDGSQIPSIKEILMPGGKYYNECLFSKNYKPGTYFQYVNLNFGIAGTIVEKISRKRFDLYEKDFILTPLSQGMDEIATFNPASIQNTKNLGVIYDGQNGKWAPHFDYYPDGKIPARNLIGYEIGTNGVIYGPQGSLRASASHLTRFALMITNEGKSISGKRILSPESTRELIRWRYQYHGADNGPLNDFHTYGLGMYGTTYRKNDQIIGHKCVRGHLGAAYNLISGLHFWDDFTLTYIINGALNGYKYGTGTIYEYERLEIHKALQTFISDKFSSKKEPLLSTT